MPDNTDQILAADTENVSQIPVFTNIRVSCDPTPTVLLVKIRIPAAEQQMETLL